MLSKPVPSWLSSDNKTHTDYLKYLKHELELVLAKAADNSVAARKIIDFITKENISDFVMLLTMIGAEFEKPSSFVVKQETTSPTTLRLTAAG